MNSGQASFSIGAAAVAVFILARAASAQCAPSWLEGTAGHDIAGRPYALCVFDPDHEGNARPQLFVGGSFGAVGGYNAFDLVGWNGEQWYPVPGDPGGGPVRTLAALDPDGDGPIRTSLFVARSSSIQLWQEGSLWRSIGAVGGLVLAFTQFDPDGTGPMPSSVVAGGNFTSVGGVSATDLAAWDGAQWRAIAPGFSPVTSFIRAVTVFDADGDGPMGPMLVVGGVFSAVGGTAADSIAAWDGSSWSALGDGLASGVMALAVHDFDGPGGQPARLVAATDQASEVPSGARIMAWDGASWSIVGDYSGVANALLSIERPGGPGLVAVNLEAREWDGAAWQPPFPAPGAGSFSGFGGSVFIDPDADGPEPERVVFATWRTTLGFPNDITTGTIRTFEPVGTAPPFTTQLTRGPRRLQEFDEDGPGPGAPALFAGDAVISPAPTDNGMMFWDGVKWRARALFSWAGTPVPGRPNPRSIAAFDLDGHGPGLGGLAFGGEFGYVGWDGVVLQTGTNAALLGGELIALGPPPIASTVLLAAGKVPWLDAPALFAVRGNSLHAWDGSAWTQLAVAVPLDGSYLLRTLVVADPDGDGPLDGDLILAGQFTSIGGQAINSIARFDGTAWRPIGTGFSGAVESVCMHDFDGDGPQPARLVAGGSFVSTGDFVVLSSQVAVWNGSVWSGLGSRLVGRDLTVYDVMSFDADGSGGQPAQLLAAGSFAAVGSADVRNLARWDGVQWREFAGGANGTVFEMGSYDPDGPGSRPAELHASGEFTGVGGVPARFWSRWSCAPCAEDVSRDGRVGLDDLAALIRSWDVRRPYVPAHVDVDRDGTVGLSDVGAIIGQWGSVCP